jgi:hypothetical protein
LAALLDVLRGAGRPFGVGVIGDADVEAFPGQQFGCCSADA